MRDVAYSDKPLTMGQIIAWQRAMHGDFEAMASLITVRTDLTMDDVFALEAEDIKAVFEGVSLGINRAAQLFELGQQLPDLSPQPPAT